MSCGLRLPLQVGTSCLGSFSRAATALVPGLLPFGALGAPLLLLPLDEALDALAGAWLWLLLLCVLGASAASWASAHLRLAVRERPSDILLDDAGLRIVGGPLSGLLRPWSDVTAACEVTEGSDDLDETLWHLRLALRGEGSKVIASAENATERASLEALCATINAFAADRAGAGGRAEATVELLRCASCGAPATPADAPAVICEYCRAQVPVPDALRERLRGVQARDASVTRSDDLVRRLLRQPGALRTSVVIGVEAALSLLVWPAVAAAALVLYVLCYLRVSNAIFLSVAAFAAIAGLFYLVRGQLTDRQALRLLTLRFAARAPASAGAPHACRVCAAPLVEPPGAVVIRCVYCSAENVLGLDVRGQVRAQRGEERSLEAALTERRAEHRRWRWRLLVAVGLLALSAVSLPVGLRPPHPMASTGWAGEMVRVTYNPFDEFHVRPSPDGRRLLYALHASGEEREQAILLTPRGGAFRGTELVPVSEHAVRAAWLPRGSGFLYVSRRPHAPAELRRVDSLAPSAPYRTILTAGYDIEPTVSPDGERLCFAAAERSSGPWALFLAAMDGGRRVRLTEGFTPVWSPRADRIAFVRVVGGYRRIFTIEPSAGAQAIQLTSRPCHREIPAWSPDGRHLALIGNCTHREGKEGWNLYVACSDGSRLQQVTAGSADIAGVAWSGHDLFFSAEVANSFDIWRIRLDPAMLPGCSP